MENKKNHSAKGICESCEESQMRAGNCCGAQYYAIRILLGLFVLLMVFWGGFKLGEFKSRFENGFYGESGYSPHNQDFRRSYMMMRGWATPNQQYPGRYITQPSNTIRDTNSTSATTGTKNR
jgi:hypothetical protein